MNRLLVILSAVALLCLGAIVARAQDASVSGERFMNTTPPLWDIDAMNRQIDLTNVVVGDETGGFCSGTIISKEPKKVLILTAAHCTEMAYKDVEKEFVDEKTGEVTKKTIREKTDMEIWHNTYANYKPVAALHYLVTVKASNRSDDVAILLVLDETYTPDMAAPLAPPEWKLRRGQKVYAVGNPMGEFDNSITDGIISNTERTLEIDGVKNQYFQFSAPVVGGNSGGSILNEFGQIIGTVSAGVRGSNIGFGAPIEKTKNLLRSAGFGDVAGWPSKKPDQPKAGH